MNEIKLFVETSFDVHSHFHFCSRSDCLWRAAFIAYYDYYAPLAEQFQLSC